MINIAVIGAGRWGPNLIKNLNNHQDCRVVWIADKNTERLRHLKERYAEIQVTTQSEQAIGDPAVDAIVIATPTSTHSALIKAGLQADKHILVEKPVVGSLKEANEIEPLAAAHKKVFMVGHVFLYNNAVRWIKDYLDAGKLGQVFYLTMSRNNLGPIRGDVNVAWDLASHDISIANFWLGNLPTAVSAIGGNWINPGVEDAIFATLSYPGCIKVRIDASWLSPNKNRYIGAIGSLGMLTFDDVNIEEPIRIYDKGVTSEKNDELIADSLSGFRASIHRGDTRIPAIDYGEPLLAECKHFIECIKHGKTPLTGAAEGFAAVRVLEALSRSLKLKGQEVLL